MKKLHAYWRLMRFDKPIGIILLWAPTAWSLWIANRGMPSLKLLVLFLSEAIIMSPIGTRHSLFPRINTVRKRYAWKFILLP